MASPIKKERPGPGQSLRVSYSKIRLDGRKNSRENLRIVRPPHHSIEMVSGRFAPGGRPDPAVNYIEN